MYYNTVSTSGQLLLEYRESAKKQEDLVLEAYRILGRRLSPYEVATFLIGTEKIDKETPLQSIRRAITDLAGEMKLRKTDEKVKGKYKRNEHRWELI